MIGAVGEEQQKQIGDENEQVFAASARVNAQSRAQPFGQEIDLFAEMRGLRGSDVQRLQRI